MLRILVGLLIRGLSSLAVACDWKQAAENFSSLRVPQKCGIQITGTNRDVANGRRKDTEEYLIRLDRARRIDSIGARDLSKPVSRFASHRTPYEKWWVPLFFGPCRFRFPRFR